MNGHIPHSLDHFPVIKGNEIIHYSCNAPAQRILDQYGIRAIGDEYGCADSREVLGILIALCKDKGYQVTQDTNVLIMNLENMLKNLK